MNYKKFFGYSNGKFVLFIILFVVAVSFFSVWLMGMPSSDYPPTMWAKLVLLPIYILTIVLKITNYHVPSNGSMITWFFIISSITINLIYLWVLASMINSLMEKKVSQKIKHSITIILVILMILMAVMDATIKEKQQPQPAPLTEEQYNQLLHLLNEKQDKKPTQTRAYLENQFVYLSTIFFC